MSDNVYYVYLHRRADDNEVFYVGKGKNYRYNNKDGRNKWWNAVVAKHGFITEFVEKGLSEDDAFDLEVETIKFYRECGHKLCNIADGGEGSSGTVRKQPIVDGTMIDLNIVIPQTVRNRTKRWKVKNRNALHVVISNLLNSNKVYYNRNKNKATKVPENLRSLNNRDISLAIEYLVSIGFAISTVTKRTDSVKTLSYVEPTEAIYYMIGEILKDVA